MHYRIDDGHPLPHNPFKALVAPRPIGWISSIDSAGNANLAPFSYFNACGDDPPLVMFAQAGRKDKDTRLKDSISNVRQTGEFACNIVGEALKDAMNASSGPHAGDVDEFSIAGLAKADCLSIGCPRVAEVPAVLECRLVRLIQDLPASDPAAPNIMAIGEVVAIYIDDAVIIDGRADLTRWRPIARCGYRDYATVEQVWPMTRPQNRHRLNSTGPATPADQASN